MLNTTELQIMSVFSQLMPKMTDLDKEKLLSFSEGMAFMVDFRNESAKTNESRSTHESR